MSKSNYTYKIFRDERVISIVDLDGPMSVTNNIDRVVEEITNCEHILISRFCVIYKDTSGVWDGYDPLKDQFIILNEQHEIDALIEIQKQIKNFR